jgi:hypothetical protein
MSTTQVKAAPAARLTISLDGEKRELFMSFGLLNELCRAIGNLEAAVQIPIDNELRDYTLLAVLSKRDDQGAVADGGAVNLRTLEIEVQDAEDLLAWVSEHVTDFFLRTMERVVKTQKAQEGRFLALAKNKPANSTPSQTGSAS